LPLWIFFPALSSFSILWLFDSPQQQRQQQQKFNKPRPADKIQPVISQTVENQFNRRNYILPRPVFYYTTPGRLFLSFYDFYVFLSFPPKLKNALAMKKQRTSEYSQME